MSDKELRYFTFETRDDSDGKLVLEGYAAVFNSLSRDLGGFKEVIKRGAFSKTLKSGYDFKAFLNHSMMRTIGRVKNNTLHLEEDDVGLKVRITLPNSQFGRDIAEEVRSGYMDQMSFGFYVDKQSESVEGKQVIRTIEEASLVEVSVVSEPAYLDTSVAKRSLQSFLEQNKYNPLYEKDLWIMRNKNPEGL